MFSNPSSGGGERGGGGKRGSSRDGFDIYVGNLPHGTTEEQLKSFFKSYGEVLNVTLKENFGFVRFAAEEHFAQALGCNGSDFFGAKIIVKKGNKKSGGGGGKRNKDGDGAQNFSGNKPDLVSNHQALPIAMGNANKPSFKVERKEELVVSHVESPVTFWAQNVANSETISDITMKLQSLCSSVLPSAPRPTRDKVYAAQYSEDNNWYRCKVLNTPSQDKVHVLYIDYGNSETRSDKDLVELPPGLQQPVAQASRYMLYGLNACHPDQTTAGFEQGRNYLKSLVESKVLQADIISCEQFSVCTPVVIYVEKQDVNQLMLDKGHAEKRPVIKSLLGSAPGSFGNAPGSFGNAPGSFGNAPGSYNAGQQQNRHSQPKSKFTATNKSHQPHKPKSMENASITWEKPQSQSSHGPPMWLATKGSSGDNSDVENLRSELNRTKGHLTEANAQAEKQRIRYQQQIDRLTKENSTLRGEMNATRGELQSAQSTAQRNDFSLKLRMLLRDVNRVRSLRSQFPTDDNHSDLIENCLMLLLQDDPLKGSNIMAFVDDVEASCASFDVIQNRIRSASSVDEVNDILELRNEARCELHKKIDDFMQAIEKFPVDNAAADFQIMVHCLEETYEAYMRGPFDQSCMLSLEEVDSKWRKWKTDNAVAVQEVRTDVNTCHNKVDSLLSQLQEQLRLNTENANDVNSSCLHLPQSVTDLQGAINKEIALTDLEDKNEVSLEIRAIVRSLVHSCNARLEQLGILKAHNAQFVALQEKLTPWLKNKPDLQEVQSMRKSIRACNSKLRHRLADKLDLEEADDSTKEEIDEVKKNITELRNELQDALAKQDELVSNVQEVILNQFPELALEYADLGIKTCAEYSGLVKEGRSLDHFDLEPIDNKSKGIYKSKFCGKPIVLKEYLVDENMGISKSEFLRRVQSYQKSQSDFVLPLQGVFFTKNERQAIVQIPHFDQTLAKKVDAGDLDFELVQNLLRSVVEGVSALHRCGIVHGSINPENIFLTESNKPMLSCIDFLKSPEQRAQSNNPQFSAPEVMAGSPVTFKSDVYSIGVLTFWLNFPKAGPMTQWPDEAKDTPLQQLVIQATEKSPSDRPEAAELLTYPLFKTRMVVSKDTIQLRVKTNCQKSERGGILKNSSPTKEHPPPDVIIIAPVNNENESEDPASEQTADDTSQSINGTVDDVNKLEDSITESEMDCTQEDVTVTPENTPNESGLKKLSSKLSSQVMYQNEGTPTLPCTPMDTPSNTPIESENNTPSKPSDLHSSAIQASLESLLAKKTGDDSVQETEEGE